MRTTLIRCGALLGLAVSLTLPARASAQGVPTAAPGRAEIIAAARDIMKTVRYATLVTLGAEGRPQARVVDPFEPDSDLTIWVATNALTRKVAEITADARVTLLYFDAMAQEYVSVLGTAKLVSDPAEKLRHWKDEWGGFYQDGPRGADYLLIRVRPTRMEVVSPRRGIMNDPTTWRPVSVDLP
jgi:general stress protein 26